MAVYSANDKETDMSRIYLMELAGVMTTYFNT